MALGINTNVASLAAQNQLSKSQGMNDQALERLSSGLRINSAKDDAAGLAISTRFSAQISGSNVAQRNANDGISFAQTAEGALGEITNALSRIRDLAVQSANDTNSASDREALNQETQALIDEVNRIGSATQFNGQNVIDGTLDELVFQVGANAGQTINVAGVDARGSQLGSEVFEGLEGVAQSAIGTLATANDLTVNGQAVDFTGVTSSADLADAINELSSASGVTATLNDTTTADLGALTAPTDGDTLTVNGTEIVLAASDTVDTIADKLNQVSDQTGVTAVSDGTNLSLVDDAGESIETAVAGTSAAFGNLAVNSSETFDAGIDLSTDVGGSITLGGTDGASEITDVFGATGTLTTEADVLNDVNVLTRESASAAINTVDKALDDINGIRAELGAVQSRFESTISNLASTTENLSAANSRILDADFAAETANLAKSQVLQQAGISVLAQANARPQQVLSLLQ
ncbi:flagellin N-terminal helical domain-containing protein [Marinobacter orientalis]|uniref:Flagellin n=1 Tax=Marinobacter orientalis TaxID=1928859 RepID=A0A7Y0WTV3_9GAMM|nr:flagellin [Marinobacter orientalis]NMT65246.1 flagellin [Marinobacter orientalis]TGX47986.1 flagellin [Marinobacter orientalis]